MTVGENIRRIRQERHLTQRQLGEMVGASEAYIRAYESGRRNPKPSSLEKIAEALAVNPEVLANSDFDGVKAIHRLFQIFRQYDGSLFEYQDKDGNDMVGISFGTLSLMRSWLERYEKYMDKVEKCNEIKDVKKRGEALLKAEADFNVWMDIYPESEAWQDRLKIQKALHHPDKQKSVRFSVLPVLNTVFFFLMLSGCPKPLRYHYHDNRIIYPVILP